MRLARISSILAVFFAGTVAFTSSGVDAQAFPSKNITIVVPYSAGGSSDLLTRAVGKALGDAWGQNVIIENRPGASGMIGAEAVFASQAGIDLRHVPYKGIAPAVTAVASGEVDSVIASHPALLPMLKGHRVRPIAVTSTGPSDLVPELPAIAQSGLPGYEYELWWGIFAPAGTPPDRVQALNAAINKILQGREMKQFLDEQGAEATPRSLKELSKLLPSEIERYRKIAREAGIKQQ